MMPKNTDRRTRRTQESLRAALITLLSQKELRNISVKELTELADVNRSTFYLHYADIYDLYQKTEDYVVEEVTEIIDLRRVVSGDSQSFLIAVRSVFDYVAQNAALFTAMLRLGNVSLISRIVASNKPQDEQGWRQLLGDCDVSREYYYSFITSGCVGLVRAWLEDGMRDSPAHIAAVADQMIAGILRQFSKEEQTEV